MPYDDEAIADLALSDALAEERRAARFRGWADCVVCNQRVRGSGPWCDLYMQGEIRCIGQRMGRQAPEVPQG